MSDELLERLPVSRQGAGDVGGMTMEVFRGFNELPPDFANLISTEHSDSYFQSQSWYEALIGETLDPRDDVRLYGVENSAAEPLCLMVAFGRLPRGAIGAQYGRRALSSFTNVYSVRFALNFAPGRADDALVIDFLVDAIAAEKPRWTEIGFRFLDRDSAAFGGLSAALRRNGYVIQEYFQYANYFEQFKGVTSDEYVAGLGSAVRRTLARRVRKLERMDCSRFEVVSGGDELDLRIDDYERIYRNSWKGSESRPDFLRRLMRQAAADGALRLGLLYVQDVPAAAQLTFVWRGNATMYKTAYDERFGKLCVGGVVTMKLMRYLIDVDKVREIDFGIGEESYKGEWLSKRRECWGILGLHPSTVHGIGSLLTQAGRKVAKTISVRLRGECAPESGSGTVGGSRQEKD
jgi:hypothetical protein